MKTKAELEQGVKNAKAELAEAEAELLAWSELAENNVFASLEEAADVIQGVLEDRAASDCEGAYNCGAPTYTREFMVDGKTYVGTLALEYNRHDKTYYYIEEREFSFCEKAAP